MAPTAQTLPYPCSTVAAQAICLDRVSSFPRLACGLGRASVALSPASLEAKRLRFGRHRVAALPHPAVLRARRSRLARPRATAPEGRAGMGPATDSGSERARDARHPDGDPATRAPADEHGAARETVDRTTRLRCQRPALAGTPPQAGVGPGGTADDAVRERGHSDCGDAQEGPHVFAYRGGGRHRPRLDPPRVASARHFDRAGQSRPAGAPGSGLLALLRLTGLWHRPDPLGPVPSWCAQCLRRADMPQVTSPGLPQPRPTPSATPAAMCGSTTAARGTRPPGHATWPPPRYTNSTSSRPSGACCARSTASKNDSPCRAHRSPTQPDAAAKRGPETQRITFSRLKETENVGRPRQRIRAPAALLHPSP